MNKPTEAIKNLRANQEQINIDGSMVGVSRQALEEVLNYIDPPEDDLGELDPAKACGFGDEGCTSCQ